MKNNKVLIIVGVILLNIMVAFMIGQSLLGKTSQYDKTLAEARTFAQNELCSKSIDKYNEVLIIKDTLDVQLEMLEVYEKGIDIGEFTDTYDIFSSVTIMVDNYRDDAIAYESACDLFFKYGKYEECANILMKARDLHVTSEKIEEYREQIRYQYTKYFSMYTDLLPMFDGVYTVKAEDTYTFLNKEGSPDFEGGYLYSSSFSEGYAFVKGIHPDGEDRTFLINKEGKRQVYFDGVETSSGVGKAKDADGNAVYLLSCKVGDVYKYYDVNGKEVFGEYSFAGRFRNNVAAVKEKDGSWKLINGSGEAITDIKFTDVVLNEFDECAPKGIIIANSGDGYRLYDLSINQISGFVCDGAKAFVDDYAAFKKGELWGFVGTDGTVLIDPQYDDAKSFSNLMGAVKNGEMWSFINPDNEVVIPEEFEDVDYLNDKGVCFVKFDGYWSYLKMYYYGK